MNLVNIAVITKERGRVWFHSIKSEEYNINDENILEQKINFIKKHDMGDFYIFLKENGREIIINKKEVIAIEFYDIFENLTNKKISEVRL